jgi:hypothetical protein
MKIAELLGETLDRSASLDIAHKWLNKNGWWSEHSSTHLTIRNIHGVADLMSHNDAWDIDWFRNGSVYKRNRGLSFEKAVKALEPLKTTPLLRKEAYTPPPGYKVHAGEKWERPISAPLIWRAIRHATEVEKKTVWSDIPGAEGEWTIRYSETQKPRMKPGDSIEDLRYFYVRVQDGHGGDNWFEIIPEDDDLLEMHPDNVGGYEITNPDGGFQT